MQCSYTGPNSITTSRAFPTELGRIHRMEKKMAAPMVLSHLKATNLHIIHFMPLFVNKKKTHDLFNVE